MIPFIMSHMNIKKSLIRKIITITIIIMMIIILWTQANSSITQVRKWNNP